MMNRSIALAVAATLLSATAARAQITFTPVVDTTNTTFERFGTFPSLSNAGHVAFYAERDTTYAGLFQTSLAGTPITTIADSEGPFSVLDAFTSINTNGQVAFTGILETGEAGVFKWSNSMVSTVSQPAGTFLFLGGAAQINAGGTAAFFATRAPAVPVVRGIYAGDGTAPVTTVADNSGPFSVFGDSPAINATGSVVFFATVPEATDAGLYRGTSTGGPTAPILTNNSSPLHNFEGDPSLNAFGQIAFKAVEDSTSMPGLFLVNLDGTGLTTLLTTNGPFSQFDSPTINANGIVAFLGFLDNGGLGIFTGPDPVANKVIGRGDPLFGSTVTALGFYRGLNDNDQLAFSYVLANGRSGVAVANLTAIPEPSTLILTCAVAMACACGRRRRLLRCEASGQFPTTPSAVLHRGSGLRCMDGSRSARRRRVAGHPSAVRPRAALGEPGQAADGCQLEGPAEGPSGGAGQAACGDRGDGATWRVAGQFDLEDRIR